MLLLKWLLPFCDRKIQGLPLEQAVRSGDFGGGLVHHTSILRNKRCLMGYM